MKRYLAIDIGASSGRHIVGWKEGSQIKSREVYRFPNGMVEQDGHLVWDLDALLSHVKKGIDIALSEYSDIVSLSIDTWGVDYVLMDNDKEILPAYAYRDSRTESVIEEVHSLMPFEELYKRTGIQKQSFNTIYQLYCDKKAGRLEKATDFLMMPCYLMYKLCNVKVCEYTNATTMGMVNAKKYCFDSSIIKALGLPSALFGPLTQPGSKIGKYKGLDVVVCATHDTASAVEGMVLGEDQLYISSGTWSLLGVKTSRALTDENSMKANYSNEGGVGYNRYQKNIMGMWVVNRLREEIAPALSFEEIVSLSRESSFSEIVDVNDSLFFSPESMKDAFDSVLGRRALSIGDYFRCAYRSLAHCYKKAIDELERNVGRTFSTVVISGGGAKNEFLNSLVKESTKKNVIALPLEATALGNILVQMEGL